MPNGLVPRRASRRARLLPFALLGVFALPALGGCTWFTSSPPVLITSEPAGARVLIDGEDTGTFTPTVLDVADNFGSDHWLELQKPGYRPERRYLTQHTIGYTSRWIDGGTDPTIPPLPLFWTGGDFFFPFGVRGAIVPGDVYVRLYRVDEPLLGFDVLAARGAAALPAAGASPGGDANGNANAGARSPR